MRRDRKWHLSVWPRWQWIAVVAALFTAACSSATGMPAMPAESSSATDDTPALLDGASLRDKAAAYFGPLHDGSTSMLAYVLDPTLHASGFDLRWQLQAVIDHHQPIAELEEFGIHAAANGTYSVDLAEFPEWQPLEERMSALLSPAGLGLTLRDLRARGFRRADAKKLVAYLHEHPVPSAPDDGAPPVSTYARSRRAA